MRKIYNCFRCGKWFDEAKRAKLEQVGEVEICPFCGQRVYPTRGIKAALLCLWWWLKELSSSSNSGGQLH